MDYTTIGIIAGFLVFVWGISIGYLIASRNYRRELRKMMYDFDADKLLFDAWVKERMEQVKAEQDATYKARQRAKWD